MAPTIARSAELPTSWRPGNRNRLARSGYDAQCPKGGVVNLLEQVEVLWNQGAESQAAGWAEKLREANNALLSARQKFYEWYPLKLYISYSTATQSPITFSLRYLGQQVATLQVKANDVVYITIPPKTAAVNTRLCGISLTGEYPWRGAEAQAFRRHFRSLEHCEYHSGVKSEEHHIESEFLRHMKDPTGSKFHGTLRGIQPVTLGGLPFQFPVPISGHEGVPAPTKGNIDILARRGTGKGTKISVWELKRPTITAHAIEQAYIYSVTLLKMLRTPQSGDFWYRDIIGFGCKVPRKLAIESVVAVSIASDRNRKEFEDKLRAFKSEHPLSIGADTISLHIANYQKSPLRVEMMDF
ncbi:MAG: hypothetical protein ABSG51_13000 [Terracidiphilus sp.]|jgi:hypothetical protein